MSDDDNDRKKRTRCAKQSSGKAFFLYSLITHYLWYTMQGNITESICEKEKKLPSREHESTRKREEKRCEKREWENEAREGKGAELLFGEASKRRRQGVARERERVLPAHPPGSFSLLGRVNPSNLSLFLSLFLYLSFGGGYGPRLITGATRATGHESQATRTCPIQHPARDDTLPSPSVSLPSDSRSLPLDSLLVLSLSFSLSLSCRGVHTRRVRPSQE